jgi:hypothetical protein
MTSWRRFAAGSSSFPERECLDHVIILNERHLRRILTAYFAYYHKSRTHLSLGKDAPEPRAVQPPSICFAGVCAIAS